jgi:hypothetical protein
MKGRGGVAGEAEQEEMRQERWKCGEARCRTAAAWLISCRFQLCAVVTAAACVRKRWKRREKRKEEKKGKEKEEKENENFFQTWKFLKRKTKDNL